MRKSFRNLAPLLRNLQVSFLKELRFFFCKVVDGPEYLPCGNKPLWGSESRPIHILNSLLLQVVPVHIRNNGFLVAAIFFLLDSKLSLLSLLIFTHGRLKHAFEVTLCGESPSSSPTFRFLLGRRGTCSL